MFLHIVSVLKHSVFTKPWFVSIPAPSQTRSRTPTAKTALLAGVEVNDTSLLDDESLLTSEANAPDIDLISEEPLTRLQGKLDIDAMSSKIDYLSEIVEQALTADSAQPCKRKRAQFDPSEQIDTASDAADVQEEIDLPPSVSP